MIDVRAKCDLSRNIRRDLRGKKVSFNLKDSQTEVTADIIFNARKIDVQALNYDNNEAIKKLREGEIASLTADNPDTCLRDPRAGPGPLPLAAPLPLAT